MTEREKYATELEKGVHKVVFTKVDGSERTMYCTTNRFMIPEDKLPNPDSNKRPINEGSIPCFDVENKAWRSFRVSTVIDFQPSPHYPNE